MQNGGAETTFRAGMRDGMADRMRNRLQASNDDGLAGHKEGGHREMEQKGSQGSKTEENVGDED